jgi:beta-glucosidase
MSFAADFVWGGAAASYQIEGAAETDGKGLSVWDMMCRQPGRVWSGHSGEVACDHYHRFSQDAALMRQIGLPTYRFSVSWPRVLPQGVGAVNKEGLDFYDRLVDALLENQITPYLTLFHWDFPYELYCRGGWLNPDSADWFAEYAAVMVAKLSDRVVHWMTLNEPQCYIGLGLVDGIHAPGDKLGIEEALRAGHHTLLGHGLAVQALRAGAQQDLQIGYAPTGTVVMPASESEEDIAAARRAMFGVNGDSCWNISWWSDPVFLGHYPEEGLEAYGAKAPKIKAGDMETICQPLDYYGTNIYNGYTVAAADGGDRTLERPTGHALCANKWPVTPEALYWGPRFYYERYGLPILITENGLSNQDWVSLDGQVHDPLRIDFTRRYLLEYRRAAADGVALMGYFHWSVFDNFEWAEGYKERFGLVYVDYQTQERIPKDSARWYAEVIASNGASLDQDPA